jgi:serine/threonine-protein kinase
MGDTLIAGRYRPLEQHAIGGMASVWRARDEWSGAIVAIKRLHPFLMADPAARRRFDREAAALRALDHMAIVRPRDVVDDPRDPVLVMDFVEGRSLRERLANEGPLAVDEAVAIVGTVADALAQAHEAGIVHRDIKPANILVEDSGAIHLVDFGIAADVEESQALTAPDSVVGTRRYAAPERLAGRAATPASDVWSLAAVFVELVSGRQPADAVLYDVRLPVPLDAVIRRAMAHDPADRYADAGEFRDALAEATGPVDPTAETALVALAAPLAAERARPSATAIAPGQSRWSPVDRAAAVFVAIVATAFLVAAIAVLPAGRGVAPQASPGSTVTSPAVQTAAPSVGDETEDNGKGTGKGKGHDKGNGNGRD